MIPFGGLSTLSTYLGLIVGCLDGRLDGRWAVGASVLGG